MAFPHIITHAVQAPFISDRSDGTVQVSLAQAPLLWPGARVIIGSNAQPSVEAIILEDMGNGVFRVRADDSSVGNFANGNPQTSSTNKAGSPTAVPTPGAGTSWAAYTTADAAYIQQAQAQAIFNYSRDGIIPRIPSALMGQ